MNNLCPISDTHFGAIAPFRRRAWHRDAAERFALGLALVTDFGISPGLKVTEQAAARFMRTAN